VYYRFDEFATAQQKLFANAISDFASFHPSQFLLKRGGRPAACKSLLESMHFALSSNAMFMQFDVVDYFGSISQEYLEEMLPAPKAVIRNMLFMHNCCIIGNTHAGATMDRRGLPQGSAASSLVAEMVMAEILREAAGCLADVLCLHTYSDNLGGLVPPNRDEAALVECLKNVFETHCAGPFRITSRVDRLARSFPYLGYGFVKKAGRKARAFLPREVWQLKEMEFITTFANAETPREMLDVLIRLQSYCAAFELAVEARLLMRRVLTFVHADMEFHRRLSDGP
jgi:hypothetical protein